MAQIQELPDIYLNELATFVAYLLWKSQFTHPVATMPAIEDDPLVGLFAGPSDLAERSEELLFNGTHL